MGNLLSQGANGIGNAIAAPFKTVFATSCGKDVCKGLWDVGCFFQHLCVSNLIKFLLIAALSFSVSFFFLYLVCKFGVCKCIGKSMCKMCWAPFATCFRASSAIFRFLWRKLRNTKRVYRGARYMRHSHYIQQDLEAQYHSHSIHKHHHAARSRKRKPAVILKHFKRQRLD